MNSTFSLIWSWLEPNPNLTLNMIGNMKHQNTRKHHEDIKINTQSRRANNWRVKLQSAITLKLHRCSNKVKECGCNLYVKKQWTTDWWIHLQTTTETINRHSIRLQLIAVFNQSYQHVQNNWVHSKLMNSLLFNWRSSSTRQTTAETNLMTL